MKKMKIFTFIGTTTAVALPMAVVSCGSDVYKTVEKRGYKL